jgi:MOSC domain-containing protein YiiM
MATSNMSQLLKSIPQIGKVDWIGTRPSRKAALIAEKEVNITEEDGIETDHYSKKRGKRQVTLIQAEHLEAVASMLGQETPISPFLTRRNIVVSGLNLNALKDQQFQLGEEVILEGTGYCHPCSRMEENLGEGGYNAMRGHGGITAKVIKGGKLKVGAKVKYLLEETEPIPIDE